MSAKTVIHKVSALSENSKMASLSQNVVRHMRNTSERLDISERVKVVNKFRQRMANSGYSKQQAKRVVISGLKGYEGVRRRAVKSGVRMHWSAKSGAEGRNIKKLLAKTSLYKERDPEAAGEEESDGEPYDRFLITPPRRAQQESKAMSPWDSKGGGEVDCSDAKKEVLRKAAPLTTVLFVEQTPWGVYAAMLRDTEEKLATHMWGHSLTHHGGRMDLKFKFVIVKTFQKALTRQISEAVRTRKRGEDLILNKKGVFNRCAVPELAVKYKSKMWDD